MYIVEVQHSSDHNLDGQWFELDRTECPFHALNLWEYYFRVKANKSGLRAERQTITGSYAGRPGRIRRDPPYVLSLQAHAASAA